MTDFTNNIVSGISKNISMNADILTTINTTVEIFSPFLMTENEFIFKTFSDEELEIMLQPVQQELA